MVRPASAAPALGAHARRLIRGLTIQLGALAYGFGGCAVILTLAVITGAMLSPKAVAPLFWIGSALWLMHLPFMGALVGLLLRRRMLRMIDGAFAPNGLTRRSSSLMGFALAGTHGARACGARITRGPNIKLWIEAAAGTRAGFGWGNPLARRLAASMGYDALDLGPWPALVNVAGFALDPSWAGRLLDQGSIASDVALLVDKGDGMAVLRTLHIEPEAVTLTLGPLARSLTPAHVEAWLQALADIAAAIDVIVPPAAIVPSTPAERRLRGVA